MHVLSRDRQLLVLHMLVEGNSLRSIQRLTGVHRDTVAWLMVRAGERCRALLDSRMRGVRLNHLQLDELWTFVKKKQGHLREEERADTTIGDQFLFVALDEETKLIPCFALGKRNGETTARFIDDLAERIVHRESFQRGHHPQISTDGWQSYPTCIEDAFGSGARYGVIVKSYEQAEQPGRYGPPVLVDTERRVVVGPLDLYSICTSHVERSNLTIRTFLRRFTRLALGFSKKLENLSACIALYVAHYDYCRAHGSLRGTPAMAARLTGHPWTLEELLEAAARQ
jgi:IS1 family transposase